MDKSIITIELPRALEINEALAFRDVFKQALIAYIESRKTFAKYHDDEKVRATSDWYIALATVLEQGSYDHQVVISGSPEK